MNKEGLSNALILYYNYMNTASTFVVEFVVEFVVVYHATTRHNNEQQSVTIKHLSQKSSI